MSPLHGFILGLVQGITEFLPVSSSGHLVIGQKFLGMSEPPVTFDILVQAATLFSVLYYFRRKIIAITKPQLWFLFIGSIPAGIIGVFLEDYLNVLFNSPYLVIGGLFITGVFMIATKWIEPGNQKLTTKKSLFIGSFQALAITPGISRSGSTVFGTLLTGLSSADAFTYSFLLSIPAIGGAAILHLIKLDSLSLSSGDIIGFVAAGISGLFAINLLNKLMYNRKLHYFGYYCLILGTVLSIIW